MEKNIFDKIVDEAKKKGEEVLQKYTKEAEEYTSREKFRIDEELKTELSRRKKRIAEKYNQQVSARKIETKMQLHNKKYSFINDLYSGFLESISSGENYNTTFASLLKKYSENGDTIIVNSSEEKLFKEKIVPLSGLKINISKETMDGRPLCLSGRGFMIDRGKVNMNCTLKQLESRFRELSELELPKILFGKAK